jgi:hypothetical protein
MGMDITRPVRASDLTAELLAPVQRMANRHRLPETVWPSRWYGPDFQGADCLLTVMAGPGLAPWDRPSDAAEGSDPILTVLPDGWFS